MCSSITFAQFIQSVYFTQLIKISINKPHDIYKYIFIYFKVFLWVGRTHFKNSPCIIYKRFRYTTDRCIS